MSTVKATIEIAASPQTVWDTIMNPERLGDWVTIHKSVKGDKPPLSRGAEMDQCLHMRGVNFTVHWELDEVDAPRLAQWNGRGPARSRARIRYELSEHDGHTVFQYTNEFSPPGGMLGNVASRVIVGAASEREANASLRALKQLLEH